MFIKKHVFFCSSDNINGDVFFNVNSVHNDAYFIKLMSLLEHVCSINIAANVFQVQKYY